ncbi:MAG: tRNA dimethylallyltransferase [Candidatus Binatia bacterium]|nr:MAG: tRNA dimethylallyltransferase [Candidatus Binatia bacterium]
MEPRPRIAALVGPTGSGKTELAIELARRLDAEIVSADSRQVYRGLDIGSAKPTAAQRAEVRHFVLDVVDPDEPFDCARFRREATLAIADILSRGKRPLVVGGTGLYLRVLRGGLFPGPGRDEELRRELLSEEARRPGSLHRRLREVDPEAARRLHPRDLVRLVRALEVFEKTGRPISAWQAGHRFAERAFDMLLLGLDRPRAELYRRIDERCALMVQDGLVEEVQALYARGYGPDLPPLRSPGYKEIGEYLRGECTLDEALSRMARATRRLAKRQLTWFRGDPEVVWEPPDPEVLERRLRDFWEGRKA